MFTLTNLCYILLRFDLFYLVNVNVSCYNNICKELKQREQNMERIKKHTLLIGLNDKDTKKQIISLRKAKQIVMDICGDCTVSDAIGKYTHDDGTEIKEKSLRVEMLFKADNEVISIAKHLKKELNQESIALSVSYENSMLV